MFQMLGVDEYYYQRKLEAIILGYIGKQNSVENLSVTGFICGGENYFFVQDSTQNRKAVLNSDLQEQINFCTDSVSGCHDCCKTHIFEPEDIPTVEEQIRKNLIKILLSGNVQPKGDSFDELTEFTEKHVLVNFPPIHRLGKRFENELRFEYKSYIRLLVETALLCSRVLDYIKYGMKVVAEKSDEEELMEYKEKMKELYRWKNPQRIDELKLSKYTYYRLLRADITTVQELRELSEDAIARIKGIPWRSLQEIANIKELL